MESQLMKRHLVGARVAAIDGSGIKWEPRFGIKSKFWNNGAFAYCLSYRCAIIDAIKNNHENILVMDDDAVLADNFFHVLEKAFENLPKPRCSNTGGYAN
jgi:GR25 family glycosyltransferase involved in LPS biosynthesis